MIGKPKAPAPPDPKATAAAQTGTNVTTALANAQLGNVNQIGPDGSVSYSTNGGQTFVDPTSGSEYFIPQYTQTTELSDGQKAIKSQSDAASLNLGALANEQSGRLRTYLNEPVNLSNEATEARLMELGRARLDPMIARRDEDLRSRLANQGVKAGSAAYDHEMATAGQTNNDAYTSLLLNGRQQAVQEALTQRNQPLNEISALLGGAQVTMPTFGAGTNQPSLPTVDYAGLVNENYNQRMGAYNSQMAQRQSTLGGLFGLGASAIKASDRRVKRDIKPVGKLLGQKIYEYSYTGARDDGNRHFGVMAQDVEKNNPDAIITDAVGVKNVNYGKLFAMGAGMSKEIAA